MGSAVLSSTRSEGEFHGHSLRRHRSRQERVCPPRRGRYSNALFGRGQAHRGNRRERTGVQASTQKTAAVRAPSAANRGAAEPLKNTSATAAPRPAPPETTCHRRSHPRVLKTKYAGTPM